MISAVTAKLPSLPFSRTRLDLVAEAEVIVSVVVETGFTYEVVVTDLEEVAWEVLAEYNVVVGKVVAEEVDDKVILRGGSLRGYG